MALAMVQLGRPFELSLPVLTEQPGEPSPHLPLGIRTAESEPFLLELMKLIVVPSLGKA